MHLDQKRESGEPYVTHPLNVAMIIAQLKLDVPSIVTGLLHDVVEDTHASLAEVQADFGPEVAQLVDGVTKVSKITFQSREEKQAENFRKMIIAMAQRHSRRADQARRPPAQHAHARSSAPPNGSRRSRARRWKFTRRSRIDSAFIGSNRSSRTCRFAI